MTGYQDGYTEELLNAPNLVDFAILAGTFPSHGEQSYEALIKTRGFRPNSRRRIALAITTRRAPLGPCW